MFNFFKFLIQFYRDSKAGKLHPHLQKCINSLSNYKNLSTESVPWMCYSFIDFLEERLSKDFTYFEYGSGASTIFFSQKIKSVDSVEHDVNWHAKVKNFTKNNKMENIKLILEDNMEKYPMTIQLQNKNYDIILIDGKRRNECIKNSISKLSTNGIIILDNSSRYYFNKGINILNNFGFKSIKFNGLKPGYLSDEETTIFYRENNIFNI